jgi:hypothetical protein
MDQDIRRIFEIDSSSETFAVSNEHIIPETRGISGNSPSLTVDGTKPLAQVRERVDVHASPGAHSKVIFYLEAEDVVELHKLWKKDGGWIEMRMPGSMMGYISSQTKIAFLDRVKLNEKEIEIFNQPSSGGILVHKLCKGDLFWRFSNVETVDPLWVAIRLDSGQQGYILSSTKLKTLAQITYPLVETASHDVLVGAIWFILGIAVTAGTYLAVADTGGTYLICWGAVVFGGLQFLRGLFRAVVAEQATNYDSLVKSRTLSQQTAEVQRTVLEYSNSHEEVNTIKTHNCSHCGTQGVLLMSDGRCPNCKNVLKK